MKQAAQPELNSLSDLVKACSKDDNDLTQIPTGGRPLSYLRVTGSDVPSNKAGQRTLEQRSAMIVNYIETVSTSRKRQLSAEEKEQAVIAQLAPLIKKHKVERYDCL